MLGMAKRECGVTQEPEQNKHFGVVIVEEG